LAIPASFVIESFEKRYGSAARPLVFRAPGRVNLIGEHTDYNLGFVLPMALELACYVACAPASDNRLRVFSLNLEQEREWPIEGIASAQPARDWSDYILGVALELLRAGFSIQPCNLLVWSTVRPGSGLSSSAALEVSTALALLGGRAMEPLEMAKLCRRAETNFVGMPCGIMDQYVSIFGRENAAIKIDCRSLENEVVPLPPDVEFLAVNSMVAHELGSTEYKRRVAECCAAVTVIRERKPEVESLRDVTSAELSEFDQVMPVLPMRRALHVVTENERVQTFVEASRLGNARAMGDLLILSHRSLQKDYEVSCGELDFLVDTALRVPGVLGARMTGGGFGGCTVNLLLPEAGSGFREAISRAYRSRYGITPEFYPCLPSAGAGEVTEH
jgi:galactokinase